MKQSILQKDSVHLELGDLLFDIAFTYRDRVLRLRKWMFQDSWTGRILKEIFSWEITSRSRECELLRSVEITTLDTFMMMIHITLSML